MRAALVGIQLDGCVIDLGSGRKQEYISYFNRGERFSLTSIDQKGTPHSPPTDLERDAIPFSNQTVDAVLMMNILEHLFNYPHAVKEAARVMRPGAILVGVVPFFCHYHEGPRDFFRYTHEALIRIFANAGFSGALGKEIIPLGMGPISVGFHCLHLAFPKNVRKRFRLFFIALLPFVLFADTMIRQFSPLLIRDFPLGYRFLFVKK